MILWRINIPLRKSGQCKVVAMILMLRESGGSPEERINGRNDNVMQRSEAAKWNVIE